MMKLYALLNNRRTLILGLDRTNTEQLHADKPIAVDVQAFIQLGTLGGPVQDIILMAEETPRDVHAKLAKYFDELPPYQDPPS